MSIATAGDSDRVRLRLWPGVAAVAVQWLIRYVVPAIWPEAGMIAVIAGVAGGLAVVVWWLFFSRAPWIERLGAIALMIAAMLAAPRFMDKSISAGMMGMMYFIYAIPGLSLAFVAWAVATRNLSDGIRRVTMVAAIVLACAVWALFRTDGIMGDGGSQLAWRWTETHEERLLTKIAYEPVAPTPPPTPAPEVSAERPPEKAPDKPAVSTPTPPVQDKRAEWPGFRGPNRDSIVRGLRIKTDWTKNPPVELWRRPVGPGWSSFAVNGDVFYTQEQRGEHEIVSCYRLTTGKPVWMHKDEARFWESNAGAGPRGTPTLDKSAVYTFGATGILNKLDAQSGAVIWSRNAGTDTGRKIPGWGFSSSPLVVDDLVFVAVSGTLAAYDAASGKPRWTTESKTGSYSSPHFVTLGGVRQILLMSGKGVTSVAPADGKQLWEHAWPGDSIVQPATTTDGGILITAGGAAGGGGTRRLAVTQQGDAWAVQERWTSTGLKPYFNDFVVHKGHAFGFDSRILACIDLEDGKRRWKGGRFGHGQMLLLADQDVLLVLSEEGELGLVAGVTDQFTELARVPAIQGKTWNHPALAGDVLLVRNGEEMAAFRLPVEGR